VPGSERSSRRRAVAPQTAYVFTLWPDGTSSAESRPLVKLLTGRFGIAECVIRTVLDDEFDAGRELLADVETSRPLLVVPVEAIPIRPVTSSGRWALLACGFAALRVLLAVDDSIWSTIHRTLAQIGAACPSERHPRSLHKTRLSAGNPFQGLG